MNALFTPEERRALLALVVLLLLGHGIRAWQEVQASRPDLELSSWLARMAELRLHDEGSAGLSAFSGQPPPHLQLPSDSTGQEPSVDLRSLDRTLEVEPRSSVPAGLLEVGKICLDRATSADFETLPGIGPALARRIIETRTKAAFGSVDDLQRVPGIGSRKLESLRSLVIARCPD